MTTREEKAFGILHEAAEKAWKELPADFRSEWNALYGPEGWHHFVVTCRALIDEFGVVPVNEPGRVLAKGEEMSRTMNPSLSDTEVVAWANDYVASHPGEYEAKDITVEEARGLFTEICGDCHLNPGVPGQVWVVIDHDRKNISVVDDDSFQDCCKAAGDNVEPAGPFVGKTYVDSWLEKNADRLKGYKIDSGRTENPDDSDTRRAELNAWLKAHGKPPIEDDDEGISHHYYDNPSGTTVSIWFKKGRFSQSEAEAWLRNHNHKTSGYETDGFWAYPQMSESEEAKWKGNILSKYLGKTGILIKFVPKQIMKK